MKRRCLSLTLLSVLISALVSAAIFVQAAPAKVDESDMRVRYERAALIRQANFMVAFDSESGREMPVKNSDVAPMWIGDSDQFLYLKDVAKGIELRLVDVNQKTNVVAFDHHVVAVALSKAMKQKFKPYELPLMNIQMDLAQQIISFSVLFHGTPFQRRFSFHRQTDALVEVKSGEYQMLSDYSRKVLSPDGKWVAFVKDYNLWVKNLKTGKEKPLTTDGEKDLAYGAGHYGATPLEAHWSPDSEHLLAFKLDTRKIKDFPMIDLVPADGAAAPTITNMRRSIFTLPGDPEAIKQLLSIEIASGKIRYAEYDEMVPIETGMPAWGEFYKNLAWWSKDSRLAYFLDMDSHHKRAAIVEFDTQSGATRKLFEETSDTYFQLSIGENAPLFVPLAETDELLWYSERSGWGHFYLYDMKTGSLKRQLTKGNWLVRNMIRYVPEAREIYLQTAGREKAAGRERDPYYRDLVRVNIDTAKMTTLISSNHDYVIHSPRDYRSTFSGFRGGATGSAMGYSPFPAHNTQENWLNGVSSTGRFAVVSQSRVNTIPETYVVDRNGNKVMHLETADISGLPKGWRWPEPVKVKAADGKTDIYGVVYRPSDFDPHKSYPVISTVKSNYMYSGMVPKTSFNTVHFPFFQESALAELGFIVVQLGGRGSNFYSKAFRDHSYARSDLVNDVADHVEGLKQLAKRYPYMDLDRVGIQSSEFIGNAPVQGMLRFPDFYKVGVNWNYYDDRGIFHKMLQGPETGRYPETMVDKLKGKLLLVRQSTEFGFMTFRLGDAFQRANKDVDMIVMKPGNSPYAIRRTWDYFVTHLLGKNPPKEFKLNMSHKA